ncbi:MAG TPA: cob(I)yrinic acid a,c-diamide adenosyltransferase, partial [Gammaproteobacteria bacterium]|nr:cob(I)yrinic acid a,c-diamide adenosyltransferase [Gammaproteobacteria bacterium]
DIAAAKLTWTKASLLLKNSSVKIIILDELTYMLTYGYLDKKMVLTSLVNRPVNQHVIVTGRNASKELVEIADTVSEINDTKHAFNAGIKAQKGIDY